MFGCSPDCPYAERSLRVLTTWVTPRQNGSSLITQLALTLGYVTRSKFSPKAELLSTRTAPVRNSRFFHPKRCWAYTPMVVLTSRLSFGVPGTVVPETVSTPGAGNTFPARKLFLSCLRVNCPPTDEADERVDVSWKVAVPE